TTSGNAFHHRLWVAQRSDDAERDIPSSPLENTHDWMTLGVACHYRPLKAYTVGEHRACHVIIAVGQHIRSNIWHGMPSSPLEAHTIELRQPRHGIITLHHSNLTAYRVRRRRAWHDIIALRKHTQRGMLASCLLTVHTVRRRQAWHARMTFGQHTRSDDVAHGIPSSTLERTHYCTTSAVESHHRPCNAYTVVRRNAWHAIISLGHHTIIDDHIRSDYVGGSMPSFPLEIIHDQTTSSGGIPTLILESTKGRTTSSVAYVSIALRQHTRSYDVGRGMPAWPFGSTHGGRRLPWQSSIALGQHTSTQGRTTCGMACHHRLWTTHTVIRGPAWHDTIAFGLHKWSLDVGRGMPSSPLGSTHGRMTSGMACQHRTWESHTTELRTTLGLACHHRLWKAHTIELHQPWHAIIALHYSNLTAYTVRRRRAWNEITALGQDKQSYDVVHSMPSWTLGNTHGG
ncbi:hypothetical protein EJD97_010239, partial [Solanum chilense]